MPEQNDPKYCPTCAGDVEYVIVHNDKTPFDFTCAHCGYLGVWTDALKEWRNITPEENAELVGDEAFLRMMSHSMIQRSWRDRDRARMRDIIRRAIPGATDEQLDTAVDQLALARFHSHPTAEEAHAMDADEFHGML